MNTTSRDAGTGGSDFADFVADHGVELTRLAYLLAGRPSDADDITQEALIRLYQAWPRIQPEGALAYARRIVIRQTASWARRPSRREQPTDQPPDRSTQQAGADLDLTRTLERLPPRQRAIVVLRYYHDLPLADIAHTLGISVGAVKSQLASATQTLRRHLAPDLQSLEGNRP